MVFYYQLPKEIWFIIYKMEHSLLLSVVLKELYDCSNEVELINGRQWRLQADLQTHGHAHAAGEPQQWSVIEWIRTKQLTNAYIDLDGTPCVD